jgi:O-6-methylguanine DNA methyltransferase
MQWIVTEIDGKIASVSQDYRHFAQIAAEVAALPPDSVAAIATSKITTEELLELSRSIGWEDLRLFGSKFQLGVWRKLFDLTHTEGLPPRLYSYSELAAACDNPGGVRAVAHAVAINPVAWIIPCHLIVPKESLDRVKEIRRSAAATLFQGQDLYLLDTIDVGEFAYGPAVKRELIKRQLR